MQRRQLLAGAGAVLALTVAGCTGERLPEQRPDRHHVPVDDGDGHHDLEHAADLDLGVSEYEQ